MDMEAYFFNKLPFPFIKTLINLHNKTRATNHILINQGG